MNSKNELVPIVADMTVHQVGNFYHLSDDEVIQILNAHCQKQVYINKVRDLILTDCIFEGTVPLEALNDGGVE